MRVREVPSFTLKSLLRVLWRRFSTFLLIGWLIGLSLYGDVLFVNKQWQLSKFLLISIFVHNNICSSGTQIYILFFCIQCGNVPSSNRFMICVLAFPDKLEGTEWTLGQTMRFIISSLWGYRPRRGYMLIYLFKDTTYDCNDIDVYHTWRCQWPYAISSTEGR